MRPRSVLARWSTYRCNSSAEKPAKKAVVAVGFNSTMRESSNSRPKVTVGTNSAVGDCAESVGAEGVGVAGIG